MRTRLYSAVTTVLLISGAAHAAESIPLTAVNKANEVIDAAIQAYGGADKLSNLNTIFRKSNFHTWATYQSKRPGPPWDQNNTESWAAVNFADEQFRNWNTGSGGGFDFTGGQLINGENSYAFDFRAGTMTAVASLLGIIFVGIVTFVALILAPRFLD